jgi:hypothetical protein
MVTYAYEKQKLRDDIAHLNNVKSYCNKLSAHDSDFSQALSRLSSQLVSCVHLSNPVGFQNTLCNLNGSNAGLISDTISACDTKIAQLKGQIGYYTALEQAE